MFTSFSARCSESEVSMISEVLHKGWLAPGDCAGALESEAAALCGKKNGVLLNSKASAISIACISSGIHKGCKVLVPAICTSNILAILEELSAEIVYYDVSLDTFTLSPEELAKYLTDDIAHIFVCNPLALKYDYSSLKRIVIEDLFFSYVDNPTSTISVLTFDGVCALDLFADPAIANRALCTRDWGRVGTQDEDISKRYDNWELDGVKYDYKFVYDHLGFNFKSCEMSSAIALNRLRNIAKKVHDFDDLRNNKLIKVSENGYNFLVKCSKQDELVAHLIGMNVTAHTMQSLNISLANGNFPNSQQLFQNYMFINHVSDPKKNRIIASSVLDLIE